MAIPQFDRFIAIDWSGAVRRYDGIAVAICRNGRVAPVLVQPPEPRWTRHAIAGWIEQQLTSTRRILIGLDFAFGFPFEPTAGYLGGKAPDIDKIFALWALIEGKCCDEPDFGCTRFIGDPDYRHLFWKTGLMPKNWVERKRRTEHACAE